jgi:hypothetical protein
MKATTPKEDKKDTAEATPKVTQCFYYRGHVGIISDYKADGVLASPANKGNIGFVTEMEKLQISQEAVDFLKKLPKGRGGFGELDIFESGKSAIFSWLGDCKVIITTTTVTTRDYNPHLLKQAKIMEVPIPDDFKAYVDKTLGPPKK